MSFSAFCGALNHPLDLVDVLFDFVEILGKLYSSRMFVRKLRESRLDSGLRTQSRLSVIVV